MSLHPARASEQPYDALKSAPRQTKHENLALVGFFAAACVVIALALAAYWVASQQNIAAGWVTHSHQVLTGLARAEAWLTGIENEERAYILTGQETNFRRFRGAVEALEHQMQWLRLLTADNPAQQQRLAALEMALKSPLALINNIVGMRRDSGFGAARTLIENASPQPQLDALHGLFRTLADEEQRLLLERTDDHASKLYWFWWTIAALVAALTGGLALLYLAIRRRHREQRRLLESESRFHLMARCVVDYAILLLDARGYVTSWNAGAERIKGYREDEIVGQHFSRFYCEEDIAGGKPARELDIAEREGRYEEEGLRVRKDGSRFWASVVITAMRDRSGELLGFGKVTRDLTERKRAEEALIAEVEERRRIDGELQVLNESLERAVTERTADLSHANAELLETKVRLQNLSTRLIAAQEEERGRIARELHDETGQTMTMLRLNVKDALRNPDKRTKRLEDCVQLIDRAIVHIRGISMSLRPPMLDDLGLADALEWALDRQAQAAGWQPSMTVEGLPERLSGDVETACFRIGQEALTNAARHAEATKVDVRLRTDGPEVELTVSDDGKGFDPAMLRSPDVRRHHFGMLSMSERASLAGGKLEISSMPGHGTQIRVRFPVHAAQER